MSDIESEGDTQGWMLAPETHFSRSAEEMAQAAALNSDGFLDTKAEASAALDKAFKDPSSIFDRYLPRLTDPTISTDQFRNSLPREPMDFGELLGRKGFLASRVQKAERKTALDASYDFRRALVALKRSHEKTYHETMRRIQAARENASIGIPKLSADTRKTLKYLYDLERAELGEVISQNLDHIAEIEAFHVAVKSRFGKALKIYGQTSPTLTEEQLVHFNVLKAHEQDIRQAQSLIRSIALLGDDEEPPELTIEQEWDYGR